MERSLKIPIEGVPHGTGEVGAMRGINWRRLLWPAALLLVALDLAFGTYVLVRTPAGVPSTQRPSLLDAVLLLGCLEFFVVGFVIARRQPRNVIGWLLL